MNAVLQSLPQKELAELCKRWRIKEFSLFGSVLRDDFGPGSDIDVLVQFAPNAEWSSFDLVTLRDELIALLGRQVDLVEYEALRNPFRRQTILNSRQTIYAV